MAEFEAQDDIGFLLEWISNDTFKVVDCGELKDLELFTGDTPVAMVLEVDPKKGGKPDPKNKKKAENTFEAGKTYSGFFELVEDDVKIDEVEDLNWTGFLHHYLQQTDQSLCLQHR